MHKIIMAVLTAIFIFSSNNAKAAITAVWANDGMDKVTQDEDRATNSPSAVINNVWDGTTIRQFGAKNEVVQFNLIIESTNTATNNVSVTLSNLVGPGGATIRSNQTRSGSNLFNWTTTEAELFYVRYLQIKGVSAYLTGYPGPLSSPYNSETYLPEKMSAPVDRLWTSRPNHDKFYPDIAVPLELHPTFNIASGNNQGIWADIYIPTTATAGAYTGTIAVKENGVTVRTVPVVLTVRNFTLPDVPSAKTMLFTDWWMMMPRYGTNALTDTALVNQYKVAHRHKISLIDYDKNRPGSQNSPSADHLPLLSGTAFTAANGYAGPGVNTSNGVYCIGCYGIWQNEWGTTQSVIQTRGDAWEAWFQANLPNVQRFLYVDDEGTRSDPTQVQQYATWLKEAPGGHYLPSMATLPLPKAISGTGPATNLTIPTSTFIFNMLGYPAAIAALDSDSSRQRWMYNGMRAGEASFQTDDTGTALRALSWIQYRGGVDRWFYYHSTLYNFLFGPRDLFNIAQTYGGPTTFSSTWGMVNVDKDSSNGDGILFYPGTDVVIANPNYGIPGPIASLRLKYWRRGIQDVDYITMAKAVNSSATENIVTSTVPNFMWTTPGIDSAGVLWNPGSVVGWSEDPDAYESQRLALADIIEGAPTADTTAPTVPTNLSGTGISSTQINLTWTASTDAVGVAGYKIFRNTTQVGTSTTTSFTDTGLTASTTYGYKVSAFDAAGNTSAQTSNVNVATTAAANLPDVIITSMTYNSATGLFSSVIKNKGLAATPTGKVIGISYWTDGVVRTWGAVNGPLAPGASVTIGTNGGAYFVPNGTHTFMGWVDDSGRFDESDENNNQLTQTLIVGGDVTAPSIPTNLVGSVLSSTQINLTWNASTDNVGVTGYKIFRNGNQIATSTTANYSDTGLIASTSYTYVVSAYDAAGNNSQQSNMINVTTNPISLPDTIVTALSYDIGTGLFSSTVKNIGPVATPSSESVAVSYMVDGTARTYGSVNGPLAAGASVNIGTDGGPYTISSGNHVMTGYVDDVNRYAESDENNNMLDVPITIGGNKFLLNDGSSFFLLNDGSSKLLLE